MTDTASIAKKFAAVWDNLPGWGNLAAVNHTSISRRFMITGVIFFLIGGLLALLIRTQLALPGLTLISADIYAQVFTMHGTIMMFLFAIPILEGAAMYLIPKMIGTRDLVFPRLSAFGYYCYLFGGIIIMASLFLGIAPESGWFMYTPLSGSDYSPGPGSDFWLLGITFVEISAVSAGIELTVSILRTRAPGMSLTKMPIFCWYILVMALMIVFGFPPLILASILLELERAAGMVFFDPNSGGDPLLWQHLFWLFGHPEVYIIFLPAAGMVSTILPVFSNRPLVGYRWVVLSVILTGFISFGLWVHHMFTVGIPQVAQVFFSIASMLVAIPTSIQVFAWLATLWTGKVRVELPMLWICGFLFIFVLGGLTGVMLALVPFNWQVHDTHFVVAHLHYVLIGGMLFPLIAGLYYWLPHLSGRMPSKYIGRLAFWLIFIGFNLTFLIMHFTGLLGMPRRVFTYETGLGWDTLNLLSSIGSFIMASGIGMLIIDVLVHFRYGKKAKPNPYNADTLEWATQLPPSSYNFLSIPNIKTRHPMWDNPNISQAIKNGEYGLARIIGNRRELYGTDAITGKLKEVIHIPSHSWLPLITAAVLACLCISLLVRQYYFAIATVVISSVFCFRWAWQNGAQKSMAPLLDEDQHSDEPPLHSRTFNGPGLWGMWVALLADGTLYLSLLFGWVYLWTVAPGGFIPTEQVLSKYPVIVGGLLLSLAAYLYHTAVEDIKNKTQRMKTLKLWAVVALSLAHLVVLFYTLVEANLQTENAAYDAILFVMIIFLLMHSTIAFLCTLMQIYRIQSGLISGALPYELLVLRPFWVFSLLIYWSSVASFIILPMMWQMQ